MKFRTTPDNAGWSRRNLAAPCTHVPRRFASAIAAALLLLSVQTASAQYACFPTCSETDGRFLVVDGSGLSTLAGDEVSLELATLGTATKLEFAVFDGETSGYWDRGTAPLEFILYADSAGDGKGTHVVGTWSGAAMTDNAWYTINVTHSPRAKAVSGSYLYRLRVRSTDASLVSSSAFKIRCAGTVAVRSHQAFNIIAALNAAVDRQIIYPDYPASTARTTYNGEWNLYLEMPASTDQLVVWDGDMDFGPYDCSQLDTNDADTPYELPTWAVGTAALPEGRVQTIYPCADTSGNNRSGFPTDDNLNPLYRRSPSIVYEIIDPYGVKYYNGNPSGDMEWEQFRISTAPFDRTKMDHHADSIPAGIYTIHMMGMDMGNLDAWRFSNDALGVNALQVVGVDAAGKPVVPIHAVEQVSGSVSGAIFYDANNNSIQDAGEPGIPSVSISVAKLNSDGSTASTLTATTDSAGTYSVSGLSAGTYRVTVASTSLESDVAPTADLDGTSSPNVATFQVSTATPKPIAPFGYRRLNPPGTGTCGFWVNHPEDWPVAGFYMGGKWYTQDMALDVLQRATKGDKTYILASQLIAAKLNLANGNRADCIVATVAAGDAWLVKYPVGSGKSGPDWKTGEPISNALDSYNNGKSCAPHMN